MPLFFVAAFLALPLLAAAGPPVATPLAAARLPSESEARGEGAGKIFVMPVTAGKSEHFLDPAGFQVHLAAPGSLAVEAPALPAGTWISLPEAEAELWLEGAAEMSPYTLRVARPAAGSPGQIVRLPVAGAGKVSFPIEIADAAKLELHLWSAGPFRDGAGQLQGGLVRRILLPAPPEGLAMPAGQAIAGIFAPHLRRYLLLSRPFAVEKGRAATVTAETEDVFLHFVADLGLGGAPAEGATLRLDQFGSETPADLTISSRDRLVAFWFDLYPTETAVAARSENYLLPPFEKRLGSGTIEALRAELLPRPVLEVELVLPAGLNGRQVKLEARSPDHLRTFEEIELSGNFRHAFRRLPLEKVELVLKTHLGDTVLPVDFAGGEDQLLVWEPELLALEGTVYYDGEPRRATLSFRPEVKVESDPKGHYRVELLGVVHALHVRVDGIPGDSHVERLAEPRKASGRLDIHVPPVLFSVRVIDAATRQGIDFARVEITNTFVRTAAAAATGTTAGERPAEPLQQAGDVARTDADGKAWLPTIRPGLLELVASAPSYLRSRPLRVEVPAEPSRQELELRLERIESQQPLELILPGGEPAARASLALFDPAGEVLLWRGSADAAGRAEVPQVTGLLLVTSSGASFLATAWPIEDERLALPAAGGGLLVQVKDRQGRMVEGAELALFLDGRVYRGDLLGFLVEAQPFTGVGGSFVPHNMPARTFGLLAFSPLSPALPPVAPTEITYPWPSLVELRLAQ